jgi:ribosomal protein L7/L12
MFRTSAGSLPFDDVRGIGIESFEGEGQTYRLTILTAAKPVPLSSGYSCGEAKYTSLRKTIATFLNLEPGSQEGAIEVAPSVLELIRAGRKIEAIRLLRSMKEMSLLDAKRIVDDVESGSQIKR